MTQNVRNEPGNCCPPEDQQQIGHADQPGHSADDGHDHGAQNSSGWLSQWPLLTALAILIVSLILTYGFQLRFNTFTELLIFIPAYLLSGYNVLQLAIKKALRFDFFNEFFLMSVATLGAFAIGSFSEGVAVMVFYSIGEWFQDAAVSNAKRSIKALLDIRPDTVEVIRSGKVQTVAPAEVEIGETIQIRSGERVALDGLLLSEKATFNTAALTGESRPDVKRTGESVLAGMINLNQVIQVKVQAAFKDSKLSRILEMVQDATARKSQTQLFISRFAKVYTPIVFALAVLVVTLPWIFVADYEFRDWLYRGLVFLVISCPCALVVSIPLGYFGGIGLASKYGILFKGANFLDVMTKVDTVVLDKTGTLTKGVFEVQKVVTNGFDEQELIFLAAAIESRSTHPIAQAIQTFAGDVHQSAQIEAVEEISGQGLNGMVNGRSILAGSTRLLDTFHVAYDKELNLETDSLVVLAVDGIYAGYLTVADEIKEDAKQTVEDLHRLGVQTVMLSGDKQTVVDKVAQMLGIDQAFGELLPEDKVQKVEAIKKQGRRLAFVGDGINDAPVVALADAGIAMGGLGSDATIETADIVIQNDQPSKIVTAIKIGKLTRNIVWQNICLAMGIKIAVLILGAGGVATLWEAVIADVGVALLAILNAIRIQQKKL